jgi:hypothetical protein
MKCHECIIYEEHKGGEKREKATRKKARKKGEEGGSEK